jgi:hypothetical protein
MSAHQRQRRRDADNNLAGIVVGMNVSGYGMADGTTVLSLQRRQWHTSTCLSGNFTGTTGTYASTSAVASPGGGDIAIPSNKAIFFPQKAPGIFQRGLSPSDSASSSTPWASRNMRIIPDRDRNEWVKLELTSYPAAYLHPSGSAVHRHMYGQLGGRLKNHRAVVSRCRTQRTHGGCRHLHGRTGDDAVPG